MSTGEYDDWDDCEIDDREVKQSLANFLQSKLTFSSSDEVRPVAQVAGGVSTAQPEGDSDEEEVDAFDDCFLGASGVCERTMAATESVRVDSDSGWVSDPEHFQLQHPNCNEKNVQVYRSMGYSEWEDEIRESFTKNWQGDPDSVRRMMREMFEEHEDVHEVVLYFIRYLGKKRGTTKRYTLQRALVLEFLKWKKEKRGKMPRNAMLTVQHQQDVLALLSVSHSNLMEELAEVYELRSLPAQELVAATQCQLDQRRIKEAVVCAYTLGVQRHFNTAHMLLPLVVLDKINLIETYIESDEKLQIEFVAIMDELGDAGMFDFLLPRYMKGCKWADISTMGGANSKLNCRQVYKIGMRLVEKFNLKLELFPHMSARRSSGFLHHILTSYYVNETIIKSNIDDFIKSAISGTGRHIHQQLISELVKFCDIPAAAKWARKCDLPVHTLPTAVQRYLDTSRPEIESTPLKEVTSASKGCQYMELHLPQSSVVVVDDKDKLKDCHTTVVQPGAVIGIDSEWKLVRDKRSEKLALLQLAVRHQVFLLDMLILPQVVAPKVLSHFFSCLFQSDQSLKLGYGINSDLAMLKKSFPFLREVFDTSQKVLDLRVLDEQVERLQPSGSSVPDNSRALSPLPLPSGVTPSVPDSTSSSTVSASRHRKHFPDSEDLTLPTFKVSRKSDSISKKFSSHTPQEKNCYTESASYSLPEHPLLKPHLAEEWRDLSSQSVSGSGSGMVTGNSMEKERHSNLDEEVGPPLELISHTRLSGLSALVAKYLGKPLDKSYQLSDWERRPLWKEQIIYAALDAHCLLELYNSIMDKALATDPNFKHC